MVFTVKLEGAARKIGGCRKKIPICFRTEREDGVVDSLGQLKSKIRDSEERDQKWRLKLQRRLQSVGSPLHQTHPERVCLRVL